MGYKTVLLADAKEEITEAAELYHQVSPKLSADLLTKFYATLDTIAKAPLRNRLIRRKYRKLNLRRFPYKVVYRVAKDTVFVVAFAHQKRKPYYWRGR